MSLCQYYRKRRCFITLAIITIIHSLLVSGSCLATAIFSGVNIQYVCNANTNMRYNYCILYSFVIAINSIAGVSMFIMAIIPCYSLSIGTYKSTKYVTNIFVFMIYIGVALLVINLSLVICNVKDHYFDTLPMIILGTAVSSMSLFILLVILFCTVYHKLDKLGENMDFLTEHYSYELNGFCTYCHGSGTVNCTICNGSGYHNCTDCKRVLETIEVKCKTCNGLGWKEDGKDFVNHPIFLPCPPTTSESRYRKIYCGGNRCLNGGSVTCSCNGQKYTCWKCNGLSHEKEKISDNIKSDNITSTNSEFIGYQSTIFRF